MINFVSILIFLTWKVVDEKPFNSNDYPVSMELEMPRMGKMKIQMVKEEEREAVANINGISVEV